MGQRSGRWRVQKAWRSDRSYLLAIASGMLGNPADAEDVVQEAFTRLSGAAIAEIADVRGWLVVVTRRLCLDRLGSADTRRSRLSAQPPEDPAPVADPADQVTLDDEVRQALEVVLDRLSPAERTSFILHDVFGFPFEAVSELVGRTPAACRQLARRARLSIRSGAVGGGNRSESLPAGAAQVAERFSAACEGGDLQGLIDLLDPTVAGLATVIGLPPLPPIHGVRAVARRVLRMFGPAAGITLEPFSVEGRAGVVARREGAVVAVVRLDQHAGRIVHLHAIARLSHPANRPTGQ